ncbi:MAG: Fur family transcriptional regulator [Eubacteriales bacterium]
MDVKKTRLTKQRTILLDILKRYKDKHFTVQDIYSLSLSEDNGMGMATIYRNLRRFEEQGIVLRITSGEDNLTKYQYAIDDEHSHHHLICRACGRIQDLDIDLLEPIEKLISQKKDFTITDHQLIFYGFCSSCKNKQDGL